MATQGERTQERRRKLVARSHRCKLGTMPAWLIFRYTYKVEVGKRLVVREAEPGSAWFNVIVDRVNDDGYFFCKRD